MFNEYDKDSDDNIYESGETGNGDGSDYDNFWFKNHLEDLIVIFSVAVCQVFYYGLVIL